MDGAQRRITQHKRRTIDGQAGQGGGQLGIFTTGTAIDHDTLQRTADGPGDLTAVDSSSIQHDTVDLAIHADELVQPGINGRGIDLHRTVGDDAVQPGADTGAVGDEGITIDDEGVKASNNTNYTRINSVLHVQLG